MPMNADYRGPSELPHVVPMFPLPGALLLPRGQMPLNIFEPRYLAMIDDAMADRHRVIGMIQPDTAHPGPDDKPKMRPVPRTIFGETSSQKKASLSFCIALRHIQPDWLLV